MKILIKILVATLIGLLINDTLYFLYDESSRFINTQIDVRDPYETTEYRRFEPIAHVPDAEFDEDASIGWAWIVSTACVIYLVVRLKRQTQSLEATKSLKVEPSEIEANDDKAVVEVVDVVPPSLSPLPQPSLIAEPEPPTLAFERDEKDKKEPVELDELYDRTSGDSTPITVEPNVSFISTTYDESSRPSVIVVSDTDDAEASNVEFELRRVTAVPDFDHAYVKHTAGPRRRVDGRNERPGADLSCTFSSSLGMSQRTPSYSNKCDCNIEHFEERLGVVEHGLRQTEEATKEWAKRIEQSEVDLVNLNRQMYSVLSNMEFKAPNSDTFCGNFKNSKYGVTSFDRKYEEMPTYKSTDNWATVMESEVEKKIKEIKSILNKKLDSNDNDSPHPQQSKLTMRSSVGKELTTKVVGVGDVTLDDTEPATNATLKARDWTSLMEKEVNEKIAQMKQEMNALDEDDTVEMTPSLEEKTQRHRTAGDNDEPHEGFPQNDDGDLITKTLEIVKDLEDAVYKESPKMTKVSPKVPTHVVAPYRRISFAETDGSVSMSRTGYSKNNRHKSKFK